MQLCVLCIENCRRHEDMHTIKHIYPQITIGNLKFEFEDWQG